MKIEKIKNFCLTLALTLIQILTWYIFFNNDEVFDFYLLLYFKVI
jgi:hypothetical protein